ncbi:MAG TPA: hypothetical protein VKW09_14530 [bacterium]|nr:hypothetical protein [bacterium]
MAAIRRAIGSERGTALVTALIMLTVMGFFLIGFQGLNNTELSFAGYARNNTLAFNVAEAGIQEGIKRLNMSGAVPGSTCFANSLTSGATCSGSTSNPNTNTVAFQAAMSNNANMFPVLSLATTNGEARAVRIFVQAVFKSGFNTVMFGPQINFQGDTSPTTGDTYSASGLTFQTYGKSPAPDPSATAMNLISPQVMAGTFITCHGMGGCPGNITVECSSGSETEVAPTNCPRGAAPVNWHPQTPVGMAAADFATVANWCPGHSCGTLGITISQATQNSTNLTYTPVSYTPSYWSHGGWNNEVLLIATTAPFCVDSTLQVVTVPPCVGAGVYYAGTAGPTQPQRFVDWGLVSDDQSRATSTLFFQPSTCSTCNNGSPNGKPNGIRYIPLIPALNVLGMACTVNIASPGVSAFYNTSGDGLTCPNPPIQAGSGTFTGTKAAPEFLAIDNGPPGGSQVTLSSSGSATGCSDNFNNANWGVIVATGDINLQNFTFNGYIYTDGNVYSHGHVLVRGGILSSQSSQDQIDTLGTLQFCGGNAVLPLVPQFYNFTQVSWEDRPGGQQ